MPVAQVGDRHAVDQVLFDDGTFCCGEKCLRSRAFDPFLSVLMVSSFAWRYANAREGKFQFRLRQDKGSFLEEMRQAKLWDDRTVSKEPPRKVPFKFHYRFQCNDERCNGKHKMMIENWEVGALYWRLVDKGVDPKAASKQVREKFLDELCGATKDTYFFVGTILSHPSSWVVSGVFWPELNMQSRLFQ